MRGLFLCLLLVGCGDNGPSLRADATVPDEPLPDASASDSPTTRVITVQESVRHVTAGGEIVIPSDLTNADMEVITLPSNTHYSGTGTTLEKSSPRTKPPSARTPFGIET